MLSELRSFVKEQCAKFFAPLPAQTDFSFETWLNKTPYPKWRKAALKKTYDKLSESPIDWKSVTQVKSFMKKETYPEYKYPRGINSRTDEFKCLFGPYVKAMEEIIYHHPSFIKHVPVLKRAGYVDDYIYSPGHVYVATDYSQYESHFTAEVMESIEFIVYRHLMQNNPDPLFDKCLKTLAGTNNCSFRAFKVALSATRMSGEMNTSLGNGVANFFLTHFVLHKRGYPIDQIRTVVEGDDGLTRVRPDNLPTADDFKALGFTIKIEIYDRISDASFCGLVYDPDDKQTITDPLDVLQNFYWLDALRYGKASQRKILELMRCKALSALYQYPGCPIIKAMASAMLRLTAHTKIRHHFSNLYDTSIEREALEYCVNADWSLRSKEVTELLNRPIGVGSRLLVERKYNISVATQLRVEHYFNTVQKIQPFTDSALLSVIHPHCRNYFDTYVSHWDVNIARSFTPCSYVDLSL